MHFWS